MKGVLPLRDVKGALPLIWIACSLHVQVGMQVTRVRLISKENLLPLYSGADFTNLGPSSIVHGKDPWIEMEYKMPAGG